MFILIGILVLKKVNDDRVDANVGAQASMHD